MAQPDEDLTPLNALQLIADNLREAIWISDPGYNTQYYLSRAYETIWGRSIEEAKATPRSFLETVHPDDLARVEAALSSYGDGRYHAEYRIIRSDGEVRWISARGYPVYDEHGTVNRIAGIAEDISQLKAVEAEREELLESERRARSEAESALRLRDSILRIVSHDLKNPLHTIGMAADLLAMPLSDQQRSEQLEIIKRTVARANRLVRDLLDAARIQAGHGIVVDRQSQSAAQIVKEAHEAFRLQTEARHQQFLCDVHENAGFVIADFDRILQVLTNLIGNAVKFTPAGGCIRLRVEPDSEDAVRFSVSDTGPGISSDVLPYIFRPFTQAKDSASLGTGLGLSIANAIVEAHGGRIKIDTSPQRGTTFSFTLPADATHDGTCYG